tara:strand:+ start:742 stop:4035 length:3294 start_codon:yes stop_codon:yes gene_type:complete
MPYKGSTQAIGFRQRPILDSTKEMNRKAQDLDKQRVEQVKAMQKQASDQIVEMQRIDTLASKKDKYEIENLAKFSTTLENFLDSAAKNVAKPYIDKQRREGIDLARRAEAGDQEALAILGQSKADMAELEKKVQEHQTATNEVLDEAQLNEYRMSLQEKTRLAKVRELNSNIRWGYLRGRLIEGVRGTKSWITNELANNNETVSLLIDGEYTDVNIQDYHSAEDLEVRNAILNYLEDKYIDSFNPDGLLKQSVVNTYLTNGVVKQVNEMQAENEKIFAFQQGEQRETDGINSLTTALEAYEEDSTLVQPVIDNLQNIINQRPSWLLQQGATLNKGASTKEWVVTNLPKLLANVKSDTTRNALIEKLKESEFNIPGVGKKTLQNHWKGDIDWDKISADANKAQNELFTTEQENNKKDFNQGLLDLQRKRDLGEITGEDYKDEVTKLGNEFRFITGFDTALSAALKYEPTYITYENSESEFKTIIARQDYITRDQLRTLDPKWVEDNKEIVDSKVQENHFVTTTYDKNTLATSNTNLSEAIIRSRTGNDKSKLTSASTEDLALAKLAQKDMLSLSRKIWDGTNNGVFTGPDGITYDIASKSDAIDLATKMTIAQISEGKNIPGNRYEVNEHKQWVSQKFKGNSASLDSNSDNFIGTNQENLKAEINTFATKQSNTNADLLLNTSATDFLTEKDLTLSTDVLGNEKFVSKKISALLELDGKIGQGRDIFEIVNTVRASRGLDLIEVPQELQTLREELGTDKQIQERISLARAIGNGKAEEIEVDNLGLVSINRLENAFLESNQSIFGLDSTDPKDQRAHINDLMTKASALTNNKEEMIRMVAVGLRYGEGEMQNFKAYNNKDNKEAIEYSSKVLQSYRSGAPIEGEKFIGAITDEDYFQQTFGEGQNAVQIKQLMTPTTRALLEQEIPKDPKERILYYKKIMKALEGQELESEITGLKESDEPLVIKPLEGAEKWIMTALGYGDLGDIERINPLEKALQHRLEQTARIDLIHTDLFTLEERSLNDKQNPSNPYRWNRSEAKRKFALIESVIGSDRLKELIETAANNLGGLKGISPGGWKHKQELIRLLQLEPEFTAEEVN